MLTIIIIIPKFKNAIYTRSICNSLYNNTQLFIEKHEIVTW